MWGWDTPGTRITVEFAGSSLTAQAGADGRWAVRLPAVSANATPQVIVVKGTERRELKDVLVGEVWMCSGQSNMQWTLRDEWKGDIEALASKIPTMRLIRVPITGTQEPQTDFKGEWKETNPDTAPTFTAVGFYFGRYLHNVLGVPVGLIDNSWGGSAAEAWVRRKSLEQDPRFATLMDSTRSRETRVITEEEKAKHAKAMSKWKKDTEKARAEGKALPRQPQAPDAYLTGNARPGNIFNGMVYPTIGYGIKGVIWYQGESNASRAWEYRQLFPFMIEQWRKEWQQGVFPFYWVQLADYRAEKPEPSESDWAELREAQTATMSLPATGQAIIIDIGEGKDIHPKNKIDVSARLARWALAKDYGIKLPYRSPEYKSMAVNGREVTITLDCFGSSLRPFDVQEAVGFAMCGPDRKWHWARGKVILPDKVQLTCDKVESPVAVRYAWADNPVCNLFSKDGLPVTPFRTDDFELTTKPKSPAVR